MAVTESDLAARLRDDFLLYAPLCLQITSTAGKFVPFNLNAAQHRVNDAVERQRAAGLPVRIIVPKARKLGVSTYAIGKLFQRVTQIPNHNAVQIAQDLGTAGEFLNTAEVIYSLLPDSSTFSVKPPIANRLRRKEMVFGTPSRGARAKGDIGLNSRLSVQSATELQAGRGFTYHSVHGSEVALWSNIGQKMTSILNAVPDEPDTFVLLESTSFGYNEWRDMCLAARDGKSDYELVFLPWYDDPRYARPFLSDRERDQFVDSIGTGDYGAQEPELVELHGCGPEQLNWRRRIIANQLGGDLQRWSQEFPSTLEESFGSTGRLVFSFDQMAKMSKVVDMAPEPEQGTFVATEHREVPVPHGTLRIPRECRWEPGTGDWRVFQQPVPDGQYIAAVDPAGDDVQDTDLAANHACQIIDHRSGEQVAEFEFQGDPDELAEQVFLAAMHYNRAVVAVEVTGGYGYSVNRRIHKDFKHPFMFKRKRLDSYKQFADSDSLGWSTDRSTRPILIDGAKELLREGTHGIRSKRLVSQFTTFVKDAKGKPVPSPGERSDLLMAWMIAQQVRLERPVRKNVGGGVVSTTTRAVVNTRTGW